MEDKIKILLSKLGFDIRKITIEELTIANDRYFFCELYVEGSETCIDVEGEFHLDIMRFTKVEFQLFDSVRF